MNTKAEAERTTYQIEDRASKLGFMAKELRRAIRAGDADYRSRKVHDFATAIETYAEELKLMATAIRTGGVEP